MLTISRRKIALDTPLSILLMNDLVLQSKQLWLLEAWGGLHSVVLIKRDGGYPPCCHHREQLDPGINRDSFNFMEKD